MMMQIIFVIIFKDQCLYTDEKPLSVKLLLIYRHI